MNEQFLHALLSRLDRLAAPSELQIQYLADLGVGEIADELALEFSDMYQPVKHQLFEISPESATLCDDIARALAAEDLGWTLSDLTRPAWGHIRNVAAAAASALRRDIGTGT